MIQKRRVFIALNLPNDIKHHCLAIQEMVRGFIVEHALHAPHIRFIPPEHLHITLRPPMHLDELAIERLTISLQTISFNQFELCTSDLFYLKRNQLIWLNVVGEQLEEFVGLMYERIDEAGLDRDLEKLHKPFKGHSTLVRRIPLRIPEELLKPINAILDSHCFTATEFVLKETLRENGRVARYQDIAQFPLQMNLPPD